MNKGVTSQYNGLSQNMYWGKELKKFGSSCQQKK
jgi:hypothetical protein